jgi:Effector-associated domain 1
MARYLDYGQFEMFLNLELNRELAELAAPGDLGVVVFSAVRKAESQGWIGDLVSAAAKDAPWRAELQRLATEIAPESVPGIAVGDVVSFDMRDHVEQFRFARAFACGNLVGVAVPGAEEAFVRRLHQRLVAELGAHLRDGLSLNAAYAGPGGLAANVRKSLAILRRKPIVAGIRVASDAADLIDPFWTDLGHGAAAWQHHLVVVFAIDADVRDLLPTGVKVLPEPSIDPLHLVSWVDELVRGVPDWPPQRTGRLATDVINCLKDVSPYARWEALYAELEAQLDALCNDYEHTVKVLDGQGAI